MNLSSQVLATILVFAAPLGAQSASSGNRGSIQPDAGHIVLLANQARAQVNAGPLQWDPALAAAAREHCLRMAAEGPISHQYRGEPELSQRAGQAGAHFSLIEENVAVGPDAATIHNAWMHSPGHRTNLLNPAVDHVGVAIVASRGTLYAVADYERVVLNLTPTQVEATIIGLVRASGVAISRDATLARAACVTDKGFPRSTSGQTPSFVLRWQSSDVTQLPRDLAQQLATGKFRQAAVASCPAQNDEGAFTAYRFAALLY